MIRFRNYSLVSSPSSAPGLHRAADEGKASVRLRLVIYGKVTAEVEISFQNSTNGAWIFL